MNLKAEHISIWMVSRQLGNGLFIFMWILLFCFTMDYNHAFNFGLLPSLKFDCFVYHFSSLGLLWFRFLLTLLSKRATQENFRTERNIPQVGKDKRKQRETKELI